MKEKFIKSSIILIIGGAITKLLGMINKIFMMRLLPTEGINLYTLVIPTYSLFVSLATFGFPTAVSKMVAESDKNNKRLLLSTVLASIFINFCLVLFIIFTAKYLTHNLLREDRLYYAVLSIALVIPFSSISSILRSYFFGKMKLFPHVFSNVLEDVVRFLMIFFGIPMFSKYGVVIQVTFLVLSNVLAEFSAIVCLLLFFPKDVVITKKDIRPSKIYLRDSLEIGVPTTINRLVGSFTFFLEPIVLTSVLLYTGFTKHYIVSEYGILNAFVMPTLLLPTFFSGAISQALLPVVSKSFKDKKYNDVRRAIKKAVLLSLIIGLSFTLIFIVFPDFILKFLYDTNKGIVYMRIFAPIFLLQYIIPPIAISFDAIGKSSMNLRISIITSIVRILFLIIFALFGIGIYSLILSISLNIIVGVILNIKIIKKCIPRIH